MPLFDELRILLRYSANIAAPSSSVSASDANHSLEIGCPSCWPA
ncbi:MAG: hypothetical protein ACREQ5_04120 [Candidatus Dormibacteria bacterium]